MNGCKSLRARVIILDECGVVGSGFAFFCALDLCICTEVAQVSHVCGISLPLLWHDSVTDVASYRHDSGTSESLIRESCTRYVIISCHSSGTTYFDCKGKYFS